MQLQGYEAIFFYALALVALIMGVMVITVRSPVHSALFLISTLIGIAGLFILLRAEFIAGVQILVYVGGVMVLFLFVIMLVNVQQETRETTQIFTRQYVAGYLIVGLLTLSFLYVVRESRNTQFLKPPQIEERAETTATPMTSLSKDTQEVGDKLYTRAALPFEIASVLLLVAIVGSVMLARGRKQEKIFE